jgi:hypothetical protein
VNLGGGQLNTTYIDGWFGKFSPVGTYLWSRRIGDVSTNINEGQYQQVNVALADPSGDVVVAGEFSGTTDFGNGPVLAHDQDMFLARYTASGAHIRTQIFSAGSGTGDHANPTVMAIDGSGNVIVGGFYSAANNGVIDFGGGPLPAACMAPFLASFGANGNHRWSHGFQRSLIKIPFCYGDSYSNSVAVNENGDVAFAGDFSDSLNVGGEWFSTPAGRSSAVMARFDSNGNHIWSRNVAPRSRGWSTAVDDAGDVYATGTFRDPINLGGNTLTPVNPADIFLVRYGDTVVPVLITRFEAVSAAAGVQLRWELWTDEGISTLTLMRGEGTAAPSAIAEIADVEAHSFFDESAQPGKHYRYQLAARTRDGSVFRSPMVAVTTPAEGLALGDNRPNPFNPQTTIPYQVPSSPTLQHVDLRVFDTAGSLVRVLVNEDEASGTHSIVWTGRDDHDRPVSSGVYFYVLRAGKDQLSRKMVMLK